LCDFLCFENITRAGGVDLKFGVLFDPIGDAVRFPFRIASISKNRIRLPVSNCAA